MKDIEVRNGDGESSTKVPTRAIVGSKMNIPSSTPIVGLGCSSFSSFFFSSEEQLRLGLKLTPEDIDPSHPKVEEWIDTIHFAIKSGITLLDTAPWYGHGTSEMVVGWAMETLEPYVSRESLTLNTKVGRYEAEPRHQFDFSYDATIKSVQRSLTRMKCGYINVIQLHDPEFAPTLEILLEETIPAMLQCQTLGYCKALGLTGYPLEVQHQILQATMKQYGANIWDLSLVYSHYNLHDTSLFTHRFIEGKSFAEYCGENAIVLLAAAPLSMGLLTHDEPPHWHPASAALKEACKKAASICESRGINISTIAIVVAMSNPTIPCTLLGMKDKHQVTLAVDAANRFCNVSENETDQTVILKQVLTADEHAAWLLLSDVKASPFSALWGNGQYRWDGVNEAQKFWKQIEGAKATHWQASPA